MNDNELDSLMDALSRITGSSVLVFEDDRNKHLMYRSAIKAMKHALHASLPAGQRFIIGDAVQIRADNSEDYISVGRVTNICGDTITVHCGVTGTEIYHESWLTLIPEYEYLNYTNRRDYEANWYAP